MSGWTLLELDLITGRTHQIRVHLSAIDHPIAGDPIYGTGTSKRGPDGSGRLFLHSWRIELKAPSDGHAIVVTAPLPPELESVLADLRTRQLMENGSVDRSSLAGSVGSVGSVDDFEPVGGRDLT